MLRSDAPTRHVPVRAIDRGGALTLTDGSVVRALELTPLGALAATSELGDDVLDGLAELLGALEPGDALQWYVESRPVGAEELGGASGPDAALPRELARLSAEDAQRVARQAADPAALEQGVRVIVRHAPEHVRGSKLARAGTARGPLGDAHARMLEQSLARVEDLHWRLAELGLRPRLLDGPGMSRLLLRRLRGVATPGVERRVEVVGALDPRAEAQRGIAAAERLLELLGGSTPNFGDDRRVALGSQLEQTIAVGAVPDAGVREWLAPLLTAQRPFVLSIHVRARDDGMLDLSACQCVREPGPTPDAVRLATVVDGIVRDAIATNGVRVDRGEFVQQALWPATLPLGLDADQVAHRVDVRVAAGALPLFADGCGSPSGVPFGRATHGRIERLDPWDLAHRHAGVLVAGGSARERRETALVLIARLAAQGAAVVALDAEGGLGDACARLGDAAQVVSARTPRELSEVAEVLAAAHAADRTRAHATAGSAYAPAGDAEALAASAAAGLPAHDAASSAYAAAGDTAALAASAAGRAPAHDAAGEARTHAAPSVLTLDATGAEALLPLAGAAAALLASAAGVLRDDLSEPAPAGAGALVVLGAERLLNEPGGALWLRRAVARARRDGCCVVLLGVELAPFDAARLLNVLPVRVLLGHPPKAAAALGERFALAPAEARAFARDADAAPGGDPAALWLNGDRGRALVRILDLPPAEAAHAA